MTQRSIRVKAALAAMLTLASLAAGPADARRGGSFGSRGMRTYNAPRPTYGTTRAVQPIERSMTPRDQAQAGPGYAQGYGYGQQAPYRQGGSRFGGFGGGLVGGLLAGGLIGHFLGGGSGWGGGWGSGGGGGMLAALLQIAILAGIVWLVIGFFRRRSAGSPPLTRSAYAAGGAGPWGGTAAAAPTYADRGADIAVTPRDQEAFERLLVDVQDAFGREDYARLRTLTTPEIMSYLSEELSQNATRGVRNEVSGTRLLDAEVSEAWREASGDYATIVLRYEGIDLLRDRATGAIVSGSATMPSETVELWTFVRGGDGVWKLSAIQEG